MLQTYDVLELLNNIIKVNKHLDISYNDLCCSGGSEG